MGLFKKKNCATCAHWDTLPGSTVMVDKKTGKRFGHCNSVKRHENYFQAEDPFVGIDTAEDFTCPCWEGAKTAS